MFVVITVEDGIILECIGFSDKQESVKHAIDKCNGLLDVWYIDSLGSIDEEKKQAEKDIRKNDLYMPDDVTLTSFVVEIREI